MNKCKSFLKYVLFFCVSFLFIRVNIYSLSANDDVKKSSMFLSDGNILYVGGNGTGNYSKIQDAIDNASDGDTVFVYDDSSPYKDGSLNINKSITLQGENMTTTILYCWGSISSGNVTINGFTFQNYGPAIGIDSSSNNIIENCAFNGSAAFLVLEKSNNNIIRNCSFTNLEFGTLSIGYSYNIEICYCDFFDNQNWIIGIPVVNVFGSRGIKIHHCNIAHNLNGGILIRTSSVKFNFNNIFDNDGIGIILGPLAYGNLKYNWWGSSEGPNITINARFWRQYHLKTVENGENVFIGGMTIVRELLNVFRLLPWRSEPVTDAGQQPN